MPNNITIRLQGGISVVVPNDLRLITPYVLLEQEDWFEPELRFARSMFLPGMSAVDIGANYGVYSLTAARLVGSRGRVIAFEPTPDVADALATSLETNGLSNVVVQRVALSDAPGEGQFTLSSHSELNRLGTKAVSGTGTVISVRIDTLDGQLHALGAPPPDFIKIDVEGNGLKVLKGAERTLRDGSPLVMFEIEVEKGDFDRTWVSAFDELGYDLFRLLPEAGYLVPLERDAPVDDYALNLFAAKPDRARSLAERGLLADPALVDTGPTGPDWADWITAMPYSRVSSTTWARRPRPWAKSGDKAHFAAVEAFPGSLPAAGRTAWARFAALNTARRSALHAVNDAPDLGRVLTFARLEYELGMRKSALIALYSVRDAVLENNLQVPQAPFLAPIPHYDRVDWDGRDPEWIRSAVLEGCVRLHHFSDYYHKGDNNDMLIRLASSRYASLEMTRRRLLRRFVYPFPDTHFDRERIVTPAADNLNAQIWAIEFANRR